ncbi:hypothetical protein KAI92_02845 [Candidatus Parcubacteria bacterium]|nr:hypothetical protein [Candidatus Parcubacteria bacterium]
MEKNVTNNNLSKNESPKDKLSNKKPKNSWLFVVLLIFLVLLLNFTFIWYFLLKDNHTTSNDLTKLKSIPDIDNTYRNNLEEVITGYLEVQTSINNGIKENLILSIKVASGTENEPRVLGVNNFQKNKLDRGDRIARGVSTFWEIGRNKHIAEALEINEDDLEYIGIARQDVSFALADLDKLTKVTPKNYVAERQFAGKLTQYYHGLEKFLYQLELYKKFNGDQIKKVSDFKITEFSEKMMDYYKQSFGLNDETKFQYLTNTHDQAKEIYEEGVTILEDSAVNLENSLIPIDFVDPDILTELASLRIELYSKVATIFQQSANNLKKNNTTTSAETQIATANEDLLKIKEKIEQSLLKIKVSSNISDIFNKIALVDKEIKDILPSIKKKYNFLIKNNQTYLKDLMEEYVREKSKMLSQVEEYVETTKKELSNFKVGMSTVTINAPIQKLKILLITTEECNKDVIFNLKSPSGSIISSKNLFLYDNIIFGTTFNTHFFVITNPEIGTWEESAKLPIECKDFKFKAYK